VRGSEKAPGHPSGFAARKATPAIISPWSSRPRLSYMDRTGGGCSDWSANTITFARRCPGCSKPRAGRNVARRAALHSLDAWHGFGMAITFDEGRRWLEQSLAAEAALHPGCAFRAAVHWATAAWLLAQLGATMTRRRCFCAKKKSGLVLEGAGHGAPPIRSTLRGRAWLQGTMRRPSRSTKKVWRCVRARA